MIAEILSRAAAQMREDAATEAILRDGDPYYEATVMPDGSVISEMGQFERRWNPAVALAVAEWLDYEAEHLADDIAVHFGGERAPQYDTADAWAERNYRGALSAARAYLGDE